jgi:tetratricopeptide (TPR) repeat protein
MPSPSPEVVRLVRAARAAVGDARARSHLARAWDALHTRDADGNMIGPEPYTEAAVAALRAALDRDPDDPRALHHLAVAQHSRAWDLELSGAAGAEQAWKEALGCWRAVANAGPFWVELEKKLRAADAEADPAFLAEVRRGLLENLLEIHVDFVQYYCERGEAERARKHVAVLQTAQVPKALRQRLTERAFAALTASVPEAKAQRAFAPALGAVERFLELFPQHLPALTLHLELCAGWASGLSYTGDWKDLEQLGGRAQPIAGRLSSHPETKHEPRAGSALEALAAEFVQKGYDRTSAFLGDRRYEDFSEAERLQLRTGLELALAWGRLALPHSPSGSNLRGTLTTCLVNRGWLLNQEQREVERSDEDDEEARATRCVELLRQAVETTEEGLQVTPGHAKLTENLGILRRALGSWERRLAYLSGGEIDDLLGEDLA